MRESLSGLIDNTIIFEYKLPNSFNSIDKSCLSTEEDSCYSSNSLNNLVEIIYNSIMDYSFDKYEMDNEDINNLQFRALRTRIRYNHNATEESKVKYGFYGEVLLYAIIYKLFNIPTLISRGHFYSIASKSETAGYDGYHLIETKDNIELWFGEVKFYQSYKSAITSALTNIENVISDDYLIDNNLIAIFDKIVSNRDLETDTKLSKIIIKWKRNPRINLLKELKENKIKLVYPILIIYDKKTKTYDKNIENAISHIKDKFSHVKFDKLSIEYSLFFIFLPIDDVKEIKKEVIKWIELEKPLLS